MIKNYNYRNNEPVDVLYVMGAGHCGSTLLNLCLDRHSSVIGVSEIITLNRKSPGWSGNKYILADSFWADVDSLMRKKGGQELTEVSFKLRAGMPFYDAALQNNKAALDAILETSGKSIVCDSSKNAKRLKALIESPLFRVKVIYLVRDGRAIVHAYRRKYGNWWPGWFNLISTDHAARSMMAQYGSSNWLTVRYEDMTSNLEDTLRDICNFTKINFETQMLHPDTSQFKGIGGNRLLGKSIEKIKLDSAWKTEMPILVRTFTNLAVCRFNNRYGYSFLI